MQRNEAEYYRDRARQERAMASGAKDPSARMVHLSLAEQYERISDGSLIRITQAGSS